jgi:hypothetical protein
MASVHPSNVGRRRTVVNTIVDESNGAPLTLVINWQGLIGG